MNVIKTVVKDIYTITGTLLGATGEIVTTLSGEAANATKLVTSAITATPGVIREVINAPITATAAYQAEDKGISYDEAEAALIAMLPSTASQAVKDSMIAAGRLSASLMKEEEAAEAKVATSVTTTVG